MYFEVPEFIKVLIYLLFICCGLAFVILYGTNVLSEIIKERKMAVKLKKYTRNADGKFVHAIKVTEKNYINVATWVGSHDVKIAEAVVHVDGGGDESNHRVRLSTPNGTRVAKVGEYVFRDETRKFWVGKDEFLKNHTAVTPKKK